ncbi:MAG: glycoside hydrolase family protein [Acidobacteriota bacterium]
MSQDRLYSLIKLHEGERLTAYLCTAGAVTIGVGHNLEAKPWYVDAAGNKIPVDPAVIALNKQALENKSSGGGDEGFLYFAISQHESEKTFQEDIRQTTADVQTKIRFAQQLDEVRKMVILDMCFNMGIARLLKFKKMLGHLEQMDFDGAADEMINSEWYGQVGTRAERLVKMMRTGNWPPDVP